jgi:peptidoglycan/LPS O-acetylase OafA/YrhL
MAALQFIAFLLPPPLCFRTGCAPGPTTKQGQSSPMTTERFHALDALRAFALLLGVVFHAVLAYMMPPGDWAVGTDDPASLAQLFAYYSHSFRMEVFFLLAGFFASLVIGKRGLGHFLKDRAIRIALVFAVALYPMKLLLDALWIIGGRQTGWLELSPAAAAMPTWTLALSDSIDERWPEIGLTHLWFLYYLLLVTVLFLLVRAVVALLVRADSPLRSKAQAVFRRMVGSWLAPLVLALLVMPMIASMEGPTIDTPDQTFAWHLPVLALYGLFFAFGWLLHRHVDLLAVFGWRWKAFLPLSLVVALVAIVGVVIRTSGSAWAADNAELLRWSTAFGTGLTMSLAVLGWLGLFVRVFDRSRAWVRYLADSAYWVYIVHLPLVVALQIAFAPWSAAWWIKCLLVNLIAFPLLIASYHLLVRRTWIGAWLNGKAPRPVMPAAA